MHASADEFQLQRWCQQSFWLTDANQWPCTIWCKDGLEQSCVHFWHMQKSKFFMELNFSSGACLTTTELCHKFMLQFWKLSHKTVLWNCTAKLLFKFVLQFHSTMLSFEVCTTSKKSETHEKRGATPSGSVLKKLLQNCRIKLCHKFTLQFWKLSCTTLL